MSAANKSPKRSAGARERLQKYMARAGVASRRKCEQIMLAGRVSVNGHVVTELGTTIDAAADAVVVDGERIGVARSAYYVVFKPRGYVSTASDPQGRPTVIDLQPGRQRMFPVGRLDLWSEGLVLLTNDGELTQRLLHPRYEHDREYLVVVKGSLDGNVVRAIGKGIDIAEARPARARVQVLPEGWRWRGEKAPRGCQWLRITLREGRKREIRRMLAVFEISVRRLIRVRMASLTLGDLEVGQGRWLGPDEIARIRSDAGL